MATTTSSTSSSTNIVNTLGAGSGVDTKTLAQNLVEAERAPKKALIDAKIAKTEAKISSYGGIKTALADLQAAFKKLNDASEFASIKSTNSQPNAFGITTDAKASAGSHDIQVSQIAHAQRNISGTFTDRAQQLNGGSAFDLKLSIHGGAPKTISVTTDTPAGIVSAINGAKLGITAQLLKTGSGDYRVVVNGNTGADNDFTLSSDIAGVNFDNRQQVATDAQLTVDGLSVTRSSNTINDLIDGVTLDLYMPTNGNARVDLNRETATIKDNLKALVTAYNTFDASMAVLADPKSTVETYGGALAGDSLLQSIRVQVRGMLTGNFTLTSAGNYLSSGDTSATKLNAEVNAGRHVGLSIDRTGKLTLDESKLDDALAKHFDQVVALFTANDSNQSIYSPKPGGLAGDAVKKIDQMLRSSGLIAKQTDTANKQVDALKANLASLEDRMKSLLNRYTQQFAAMDSIVGSSNSLRTSLKSSFDGMMATYTNK